MQKAVDQMQIALETESKGKAEALRMKKKLETDIGELELALENANSANQDIQVSIKKYHSNIRDHQVKLEDEQRTKDRARDELLANERRVNTNTNHLEEARTLLEQSDRARRMTEQELSDTNEQLSDQTCNNQSIAGAKRKYESEMQTLHADMDEMTSEARLSNEKASKAMVDAARLADELRCEQELAQELERSHKVADAQVKDMQSQLDEAEINALKGGKKAMNKLESRIHELEGELEAESRRNSDSFKNLNRSERKIKELTFSADEDRKNHERMQSLVDQLQSKIKCFKKQIEEAEEIAALNLAKFRKVQNELSDAAEHADLNEQALGKAKARGRSVGPK
jgi:myosin heavy chain 6/7